MEFVMWRTWEPNHWTLSRYESLWMNVASRTVTAWLQVLRCLQRYEMSTRPGFDVSELEKFCATWNSRESTLYYQRLAPDDSKWLEYHMMQCLSKFVQIVETWYPFHKLNGNHVEEC